MRRAASLGCALVLLVAGCGGDSETSTVARTTPRTATATALPRTPPVHDAPIADGRRVFEQSGCLACHQLARHGNSGPGNNLDGVGDRMSRAEIRTALVDATAPMPSFRELGREKLDDLVAYLYAMRDSPPAVPPCPAGSDCG
jgi:mono/diheme cytochrome c family protein